MPVIYYRRSAREDRTLLLGRYTIIYREPGDRLAADSAVRLLLLLLLRMKYCDRMIYEIIKSKITVETFTTINESENPTPRARRTLPVSRLIFVNNKHCDAVSSFFSARPRF